MIYSELVTAIENYTQVNEPTFVASIPTFVRQAEKRLFQLGGIPSASKAQTGTMSANNAYLSTPSDMLYPSSLAVLNVGTGAHEYLIAKEAEFVRYAYSGVPAQQPQCYAIFDDTTILLGPTPDQNYTVELYYYAYPASIVDAGTTYLGTNYDTALLYGSLLEAAVFQKYEKDDLAIIQQRFTEAVGEMGGIMTSKLKHDAFGSSSSNKGS
jgi:hypothetical protein